MARKHGLSVGDTVDAAVAVAEAEGFAAVTLSAVAARLKIRSPSLYAHVDGLEGLKRAVRLKAAESLGIAFERAMRGHTGLEGLRRLAQHYRRFARAHPGLYEAAQSAGASDGALAEVQLRAVRPVMQALGEAGITSRDEQVHYARALRSALHGFVSLEHAGGFGLPQSAQRSFQVMVELLLEGIRDRARSALRSPSRRSHHNSPQDSRS